MAECGMTDVDAINTLRGGRLPAGKGCSYENGTWRYRFETTKMAVVVAFEPESGKMVIVTAFRLEERT